ncbi:hypothetical protein, partial [Duncaniella muris]|uniref:hypothetical protein n=1 Tax=Duncaniella muris TaxID=2094150 RepID=UPI00272C00F9
PLYTLDITLRPPEKSADPALPEPQVVERVTCTDSSRFFCIKPQNNHNTIFRKSEEVDLAC